MGTLIGCDIHATGNPELKRVTSHLKGMKFKDITALDGDMSNGAYLLIRFEGGASAKIYVDHFYNKSIVIEYP
jgi:hypothetical protein